MTVPLGSELLLQDPGAPTTEYVFGPAGNELAVEHPSGAFGELVYGPQGSQLTIESGTPIVVTTLGSILAQGSELTVEFPNSYDVFFDVIPDGSQVAVESGTATARLNDLTLAAVGSELTVQSGTALVFTTGIQLQPLGSELTVQSGLGIVPLRPLGSELLLQGGSPEVAGIFNNIVRIVRWRASYLFLIVTRVLEGEFTRDGGDMVELVPNNTTRLELAVTVPSRGTATPGTNLSLLVRVAPSATATAAVNTTMTYTAYEYTDEATGLGIGKYAADILGADIADALTNGDVAYDTPYVIQAYEGTVLMASVPCIFRRWRGL